ncbi:MAG: hypothetical protein EZS26_000509 [Candidatus Ordinivivax streblomastigis]|uniref:FAS1 domain-containing protein n=1 Tax=Candidatus Ordinivivax streblomastigis TaxID=2540710 RepID=A0A5M8P4J3_9BACT|nr:MAG: hypothetical protein EZS26_000458 [Candidatus Ordinivivax streblomastigis]KAA6303349.1 MAG: hypothetical protein EZS26_000509 [Candidatus Ordinivivax streblomastigis]
MKQKRILRCVLYAFLVGFSICFSACSDWVDDYEMNDHEPDYLKASIYDYLKNNGNFTYFTRIIDMAEEDGIKYSEVLSKTGSKTLFVADDDAFREFFQNNEYGIHRFEELSVTQCRAILFGGMLNNPYLLSMLTYLPGSPPKMGQVMRREASLPLLDTVFLQRGNNIPSNSYWERYKEKGLYLLDDRTNYTLVHFLPLHMRMQGITDEDFYTMTHIRRSPNDAYLFDIKIVEPDIICKNGYVHRLEKLLFPRETMAEYIRTNPETKKFNSFLERYSFPVYDATSTETYKKTHPDFNDSIFVKWFFNLQESPNFNGNQHLPENVKATLKFNPGNKSYKIGSNSVQVDMAAMLVPTDAALERYFNSSSGRILKERYQTWDNIPDDVLDILINHHMLQSFLQATPGRFKDLADKMGTPMNVKPGDVQYSRICSNGIVYVTDSVYTPTEYASVIAPVVMGAKTTIFKWIVNQLQFDLYLLSMEEGNRFSFFVPTDDVFQNYVDPASLADPARRPETLHFYINPANNAMMASRWVGNDSIGVYTSEFYATLSKKTEKTYLDYLMLDIMNNHIVLQDLESGKKFYRTKSGGSIVVSEQSGKKLIAGGANIDRGEEISVTDSYSMANGTTYLLDKVLQMPLKSTYSELMSNEKPEFSEFFDLCFDVDKITENGVKVAGEKIFGNVSSNERGIDENVRFFSTFNYTVYVPTNQAIQDAIADGLIMRWNDIKVLENTDYGRYLKEVQNLYDFLSYHFQDNSVYVSDKLEDGIEYETANLERKSDGSLTGKFSKLKIFADGTNLSVQGVGNSVPVKVITTNPALYNLMVRDYLFLVGDKYKLNTSSFAVIHQIDGVLKYKN